MGDAQTGTGHFAWVTWGLAALGTHVLLLWSVPSAPVETTLAAATTTMVAWEIETWAAVASSPATAEETGAEPTAIAAPLAPAKAASAPRARSSEAPARVAAVATQRAAAARHRDDTRHAPAQTAAGDEKAPRAAAEPRADEAHDSDAERREENLRGAGPSEGETRNADTQLAAAVQGEAATAHGEVAASRASLAAGSGTGTGSGAHGQGAGALLRGPRLLASHDPCAGFFPGTAQANRGQVQLAIDVDAEGHPHPARTLLELPLGQGFESAAKACAAHLHFAPALDAQGHPVSARARIALRFERS